MTRKHVALQLLAHGPLTAREFTEITGWPRRLAYQALKRLFDEGCVRQTTARGYNRYLYELA